MTAALEPAIYLVATPIGNARDITLRALDVLRAADLLVAEDTRVLRKLLEIHGIPLEGRPLQSYHDHSSDRAIARVLAAVQAGQSVACCSDAGMPLIADPGFELVRAAVASDIPVTTVPGASSVPAALALSGLATDRFLFAGFAPKPGSARDRFLAELTEVSATLVLFENAKRVPRLVADLCAAWGEARQAAICRELTKKFEEVLRGSLGELTATVSESTLKGEVVLVIERGEKTAASEADIDEMLTHALQTGSVRDAVDAVSTRSGWPRKSVYKRALEIANR